MTMVVHVAPGTAAPQWVCIGEVCIGSWLRENADVLRRRRMAFSRVRCSFPLARGSVLGAHRCGGEETPRFLRFWCAAHVLPFIY